MYYYLCETPGINIICVCTLICPMLQLQYRQVKSTQPAQNQGCTYTFLHQLKLSSGHLFQFIDTRPY